MGLDAVIYVETPLTQEELDHANKYLKDRLGDIGFLCSRDSRGNPLTPLQDESWHGRNGRYSISTMMRYYGPGYERGSWPLIYAAIRVLQYALPSHKVFYGDDSDRSGMECTQEFLESLWKHFSSDHWDDCHRENG